ncbi:MAG: bifunctional 4-hydroxy-2-oxoglutarate aldolase/2-dehydro-3-deoxy-phosphogluconate aldolase [Candidatus Omnitrophica bacterium]|nr:bifunctional 4-hydroxy-2-oxoglutarate aldolase/2-dehydro-3-deoxy-phosphogluconate aldolase [Candidatus Omnitrophota bacterium]
MDIVKFKKMPVMGILRGTPIDLIEPLVETVISAGLTTIEIAMNTKDADKVIRKAVKAARGRLMIGAGTVLDLELLKRSLDSGATFIVTPVLIDEVMDYCEKNVIPVFPGALTPTEIYRAWSAGATMVKVFPAGFFGPSYFNELKGPFNNIGLMACGGVTAGNVKSYFAGGASAVAFGSSIFKKDWLDKKYLRKIARSVRKLVTEAAKR